MINYNERLDNVLSAVYLAGTENGLGRRLTDAKEIMHRKEAFIRGNPASKEAKQAITSLIKELVAEAKPEVRVFDDGINDATYFQQKIVDQYEQNLLKALEEV